MRTAFLLSLLLCVAACARKNKHIYDFIPSQRPLIKRALLPYVTRAQLVFDEKINCYVLTWTAPQLGRLPPGMHFCGYTIYYETALGFFSRKPDLFVKSDVTSCAIDVAYTPARRRACALAPLFCDQDNREVVGYMHVVRSLP